MSHFRLGKYSCCLNIHTTKKHLSPLPLWKPLKCLLSTISTHCSVTRKAIEVCTGSHMTINFSSYKTYQNFCITNGLQIQEEKKKKLKKIRCHFESYKISTVVLLFLAQEGDARHPCEQNWCRCFMLLGVKFWEVIPTSCKSTRKFMSVSDSGEFSQKVYFCPASLYQHSLSV